jgi:hypothetical protein
MSRKQVKPIVSEQPKPILVKHNGNKYAVINLRMPVVVDLHNLDYFENNHVYLSDDHPVYSDEGHKIFLYDEIAEPDDGQTVYFINGITFDLREENLTFVKPLKKWPRNIKIPEELGINANDIPSYVYYKPPYGTNSDYFKLQIGDLSFDSAKGKDIPIKCKLEEIKTYLRKLRKTDPKLFSKYLIDKNITDEEKEQIDIYNKIINKAGYNIKIKVKQIDYLEPLKLTTEEQQILNKLTDPTHRLKISRPFIHTDDIKIPKYCSYRKPTKHRGDAFIMTKYHPSNTTGKDVQTSTSKYVSTIEKYNELLDMIQNDSDSSSDDST